MLQLNNIIYGNHISRHKEQYNIMKRWNFLPHDPAKSNKLAEESGLPFVLADILSARGIDAAHLESMFPNNAGLSDPFLLADMDKAVQRIQEAVEAFEKIAVYGGKKPRLRNRNRPGELLTLNMRRRFGLLYT